MDKYVPKIDDIAKAALNARTNELTDDGAYSNHRRNLIVSESNWDENICSNVISTLPFEIEEDLRQELIQTAKNTNYKSYYELNLSDLDDKDCLKRIVDKFILLGTSIFVAKECALFLVDELINEKKHNEKWLWNRKGHWIQVKQEIQKL